MRRLTYMTMIAVMISAETILTANALPQRTTRSRLKVPSKTAGRPVVERYDTLAVADTSSIIISGYEKTLRSAKESFFITNRSDSTIDCISLHIDYRDMQGRMLDSREEVIDIEIPAGETRKADIPSWDKQRVFYYHLSPVPRNTSQATPYTVRISPVAAMKRRH